jgi:hypothetical protein
MKLPVVSGSEAVKAFCKAGYGLSFFAKQTRANRTLRALIREAGLTVDEFSRLL